MDERDRDMNQLLADLYMKEQLIRVKGAASVASFKASDIEDIDQRIDVLLARLQLNSLVHVGLSNSDLFTQM